MFKTFSFWAAKTVLILVLCGQLGCVVTTHAGQSRDGALTVTSGVVQNGTHFLVRLDQEMNTGKDKVSKRFEVTTIEPLETLNGFVLPPAQGLLGI